MSSLMGLFTLKSIIVGQSICEYVMQYNSEEGARALYVAFSSGQSQTSKREEMIRADTDFPYIFLAMQQHIAQLFTSFD